MKVADYIIDFLSAQKVNHIFYLIGGAIAHLVDSTIDHKNVSCITMHHEQGAAFAAEGYARCNGKLGVAMATSGPGATNLITGIGSCFFDSVPCLFITGQVNTYEYKFDLPVRQVGFQETDIVTIVSSIVKGARLVIKPEDIRRDLEWAVHLAQSGRPGPVLLDIPMNIQRAEVDPDLLQPFVADITADDKVLSTIPFDEIIKCLQEAKRPVVLVGGGVRSANACNELFAFIDKTNIPVVTSLMGTDAFSHTHTSYVGMIGTYGHRSANIVLANADFLLVLGSRLDTRQTGTQPKTFARAATIVHVDIDKEELNRSVKAKYTIQMHLKDFLQKINSYIDAGSEIFVPNEWLNYIKKCKQKFNIFPIAHIGQEIDPCELINILSKKVNNDAVITVDVGQHQMWVAQFFELQRDQRMLISGGMGAMGFALPAAIGAAFAEPKRQILVIVGDGGFQINIQELQTIVRNNLNIKIIVLNNQSLGMVRQFQDIYFNSRTEGTLAGYNNPNFIKIADAYGITGIRLQMHKDIEEKLNQFLVQPTYSILEVALSSNTCVEPKLIVNDPIEDQDPKLSRNELKEMMFIKIISE